MSASVSDHSVGRSSDDHAFFGHPRPLGSLFYIELWERFSFYGMQGILLFYLYFEVTRGGLGIDKNLAGGIVGVYSGSVYLATIAGAWLADRVLGAERTMFYSGWVVMFGHIFLALLPGVPGLVCGLIFVALGSGGVKSAASSMLGELYQPEHLRPLRDAGFSIFYIAVNIGSFFGSMIVAYLQSEIGFHTAFGAAAVGMAFGLWRYAAGRKYMPATPVPNPLPPSQRGMVILCTVGFLAALALGFSTGIVTLDNFSSVVLGINAVVIVYFFAYLLKSPQVSTVQRRHIVAYLPLFAART